MTAPIIPLRSDALYHRAAIALVSGSPKRAARLRAAADEWLSRELEMSAAVAAIDAVLRRAGR